MSDVIEAAISALAGKLAGEDVDFSAKFEIEGEGAVRVDENGVSGDDGEADVTMTADAETFQSLLAGELDPTSAFMSGKLAVEGDMGLALKLGSILS